MYDTTPPTVAVIFYEGTTNLDVDFSSAPSIGLLFQSEESDTNLPRYVHVTGNFIDGNIMVDSPDPAINDLLYDTITFLKLSVADNITLNDDDR